MVSTMIYTIQAQLIQQNKHMNMNMYSVDK